MMALAPFIVAAVLFLLLAWMRRGNGGSIGRQVRLSDWHAWRDAVNEKQQELDDLKKVEPKHE